MRAFVALALAAMLGATIAIAGRTLPDNSQYGKLTRFQYPYAVINGKTLRMTPGAKIYNEQNMIIMPSAMRQSAKVLYRIDGTGSLSGLWILTEQEAPAAAEARGAQAGSSFTLKPRGATSAPAAVRPAGLPRPAAANKPAATGNDRQ